MDPGSPGHFGHLKEQNTENETNINNNSWDFSSAIVGLQKKSLSQLPWAQKPKALFIFWVQTGYVDFFFNAFSNHFFIFKENVFIYFFLAD